MPEEQAPAMIQPRSRAKERLSKSALSEATRIVVGPLRRKQTIVFPRRLRSAFEQVDGVAENPKSAGVANAAAQPRGRLHEQRIKKEGSVAFRICSFVSYARDRTPQCARYIRLLRSGNARNKSIQNASAIGLLLRGDESAKA